MRQLSSTFMTKRKCRYTDVHQSCSCQLIDWSLVSNLCPQTRANSQHRKDGRTRSQCIYGHGPVCCQLCGIVRCQFATVRLAPVQTSKRESARNNLGSQHRGSDAVDGSGAQQSSCSRVGFAALRWCHDGRACRISVSSCACDAAGTLRSQRKHALACFATSLRYVRQVVKSVSAVSR